MNGYQLHLFSSLPALQVKEQTSAYEAIKTEVAGVVSAMSANPILPHIDEVAQEWWSRLTDGQRQRINGRFERALALAKTENAVHFDDELLHFRVRSVSTKGDYRYEVLLAEDHRECDCPDYPNAPSHTCKHIMASYFTQQAMMRAMLNFPAPEEIAEPVSSPEPEHPAAVKEVADERLMLQGESIIYADAITDEGIVPVEVINLQDDVAHVRALPRLVDGKFVPCYPFPSPFYPDSKVAWSTANLPKGALENVRVYRKG